MFIRYTFNYHKKKRSYSLSFTDVPLYKFRRAKSYMDSEQYEEAVRDYEHVFKTDKSNREYR